MDGGKWLDDASVVSRILELIDNKTTFTGDASWREPVGNYLSPERFSAELALLRRHLVAFCPSAALSVRGSYLARTAAGTPLLAVRGDDGKARIFRNACRHRGVQLAEGSGRARAFVCPYHGWTYGNDGSLRRVPHGGGFPGLEESSRGLVPVTCFETRGLVFAAQDAPVSVEPPSLPGNLLPERYDVLRYTEQDVGANWKLFVESFLEGYHIRSTHKKTFFPLQYDNLNWLEFLGDSTRITFPFRSIEKLRDRALEPGRADRYLTYVYHLFPNVIVATSPSVVNLVILEPLSVAKTRMLSFLLGLPTEKRPASGRRKSKGPDYDAAQAEDQAMITSAQRGLRSGANEFLEFGLFENAVVRFYERLERALAAR